MKIAKNTARDMFSSELDMSTIRRRVAQIKNLWTPEVAQSRAAEGSRRRRELDALVGPLLGDIRNEFKGDGRNHSCDSHGLTLVG